LFLLFRHWGPPYLKDSEGKDIEGESAYYHCANRNKKSIAVDFSKPEGQEVIRKLAKKADVVVENFKVGKLRTYGLSYTDMKAVKPDIIYASITGFGQNVEFCFFCFLFFFLCPLPLMMIKMMTIIR